MKTGRLVGSLVAIGGMSLWASEGHATNRYVINQITSAAKLRLALDPPKQTTTYTPSHGEVEWGTHFQSYTMPMASVTLTCDESGWRTHSLGVPAVYNASPFDYDRKATKVTGDVYVSFHDGAGLENKAITEWCPSAMAADLLKVPSNELNKQRTVTVTKPWKVSLTGECVRTKAPFMNKTESVSAIKEVQVDVACTYYPEFAYRDNEPLKTYWNATRGDNFTATTAVEAAEAKGAGYGFVRNDARVQVLHGAGTSPLNLYWNSTHQDNLSTTSVFTPPAGYSLVRTQGYVYSSAASFTVPLKLFWSDARKDYFSTATTAGEADAKAAGYSFVKVIGHVIPQK